MSLRVSTITMHASTSCSTSTVQVLMLSLHLQLTVTVVTDSMLNVPADTGKLGHHIIITIKHI